MDKTYFALLNQVKLTLPAYRFYHALHVIRLSLAVLIQVPNAAAGDSGRPWCDRARGEKIAALSGGRLPSQHRVRAVACCVLLL